MSKTFYFTFMAWLLVACAPTESSDQQVAEMPTKETVTSESPTKANSTTLTALEKGHKKSVVLENEAIQFDIELFFNGKKRLDATITTLSNSSKIRMEKADGTTLVFDGEQVLQTPSNVDYKGARFDIFTWQYFFMAPYKLSDPGSIWTDIQPDTINDIAYDRGKLTFEAGTGDAPNDWYVIYKNPTTDLMDILAYIVTYSKSTAKAEEEPHAVTYEAYENVDGVSFATKWGFWIWYEDQGLTKKLGEANVSNIQFVAPDEATFRLEGPTKVISR